MNEHYYLICSLDGYQTTSLYRIDRIKDIKISDDTEYQINDYNSDVNNSIYAFAGKPEKITIVCSSIILNDVIDKFGTDIKLHKINDTSFSVSFEASPHGIKFWALQYLPYAEVIEPVWLREEVIESIKQNRYISFDLYD